MNDELQGSLTIGMIHQIYSSNSPSGENTTVEMLTRQLGKFANVSTYFMRSDDLLLRRGASLKPLLRTFFSLHDKQFDSWLEGVDVVQIHNMFPVIGIANRRSILKSGKPIVRVVHNYRASCISGNHFRNNAECIKCNSTKFGLKAIEYKCYRSSRVQTFTRLVYRQLVERPIERSRNTRFVAISNLMREYKISTGTSQSQIHVIPNFSQSFGKKDFSISTTPGKGFIYVGRFEPEKGVQLILEVWSRNPNFPNIYFLGKGSLGKQIAEAASKYSNVVLLGFRTEVEVLEQVSKSLGLIAPNIWEEPFGRNVVDAWKLGIPVILSTKSGLASFVQEYINGLTVKPTVKDLEKSVADFVSHSEWNRLQIKDLWKNHFSDDAILHRWRELFRGSL